MSESPVIIKREPTRVTTAWEYITSFGRHLNKKLCDDLEKVLVGFKVKNFSINDKFRLQEVKLPVLGIELGKSYPEILEIHNIFVENKEIFGELVVESIHRDENCKLKDGYYWNANNKALAIDYTVTDPKNWNLLLRAFDAIRYSKWKGGVTIGCPMLGTPMRLTVDARQYSKNRYTDQYPRQKIARIKKVNGYSNFFTNSKKDKDFDKAYKALSIVYGENKTIDDLILPEPIGENRKIPYIKIGITTFAGIYAYNKLKKFF